MMSDSPLIEVLLATYNGEAFLVELLDSLLEQSYQNFKVLIRDDGSEDQTEKIIQRYLTNYPDKFVKIQAASGRTGPIHNFSQLLQASSTSYVMLCDQDDIWLPEKIQISLAKIQEIESKEPPGTPVLVHTDLKVVSQELKEISPSFMDFQALNPKRVTFGNLLVQNVITGCATILNRPLADLTFPIPEKSLMHDWWISLIASAFGTIGWIEQPTILYRQHAGNTLGVQQYILNLAYISKKARKVFSHKGGSVLGDNMVQAREFYSRFWKRLSPTFLEVLENFLNLEHEGFLKRRYHVLKFGFYKGKFLQNIGLFLKI